MPDTVKSNFRITLAKERHKFSAAHFTLFPGGDVERLHGHDYRLEVTLEGGRLQQGMLFPFHQVKPVIDKVCRQFDERVLLPAQSDVVSLEQKGGQVEVHVRTERVVKMYSFPEEEVVQLQCDNVTCENLCVILMNMLLKELSPMNLSIGCIEVGLSESSGQMVRLASNTNAE